MLSVAIDAHYKGYEVLKRVADVIGHRKKLEQLSGYVPVNYVGMPKLSLRTVGLSVSDKSGVVLDAQEKFAEPKEAEKLDKRPNRKELVLAFMGVLPYSASAWAPALGSWLQLHFFITWALKPLYGRGDLSLTGLGLREAPLTTSFLVASASPDSKTGAAPIHQFKPLEMFWTWSQIGLASFSCHCMLWILQAIGCKCT
ncbi:hypothetical protein Tco_0083920, partial [Tanacetum coccineum]